MDTLEEFPPDLDEQAILVAEEYVQGVQREAKTKAIEEIVVEIHNVPYAGDDVSQNRMGNTLAIANWKYNEAVGLTLKQQANAEGVDDVTKAMLNGLADIHIGVYHAVYKDNKLDWKGSDGKLHHVEAESIGEALYASMMMVGQAIKNAVKGK